MLQPPPAKPGRPNRITSALANWGLASLLLLAGAGLFGENHPGAAQDHLWTPRSTFTDSLGQTHTRLIHTCKGLKVLGSEAIAHEPAPGVPMVGPAWEGEAQHPAWSLSIKPRLTVHDAQHRVRDDLGPRGAGATFKPATLVVLPVEAEFLGRKPAEGEEPNAEDVVEYVAGHLLAYLLPTVLPVQQGLERWDYCVDARNGRILRRIPRNLQHDVPAVGTGHTLYSGEVTLDTMRTDGGEFKLLDSRRGTGGPFGGNAVTDMAHTRGNGAGAISRSHTNVWGDGSPEVQGAAPDSPNGQTLAADAALGLRYAWDYFRNVHRRKGFDGRGTATYIRVHWGGGVDCAEWESDHRRITIHDAGHRLAMASPTILGHEFTHGVVEATAGLLYQGESGGLDEATADIFGHLIATYWWSGGGSLSEQSKEIGDRDTPWTAEIVPVADLTPEVVRYLDQPSRDGRSPDEWKPNLRHLDVHLASGPMNRAFYFLSKGASPLPGTARYSRFLPEGMVGIGNDKAARIWYHTLTTHLRPNSTYLDARRGAIRSAGALFGMLSKEDCAVRMAFGAINVGDPLDRSEEGMTELTLPADFVRASADVRENLLTLRAEAQDPRHVDWVLFLVDDLLVGKVRRDPHELGLPALVMDASRWFANGDHRLKARVIIHGREVPIDSAAVPFSLRMDCQQLLADPGLEATTPVLPKWDQGPRQLFNRDLQVAAHRGDQCVRFSGGGGLPTLSQRVHLPEGMASLTFNFWARIRQGAAPKDGDELKLQVRTAPPPGTAPEVLATLATLGPLGHHQDWVGRSFDLAPFAGRTVEIALVAQVRYDSTTLFDVDDLTVIAAATPKVAVTVTPALLEIKAGGVSAGPLAATVSGSGNPAVTWRVREPAGGTLDLVNRYHAPREPGIYHVVATSRADRFANAEVSIRVLPSVVFPNPSIQVVAGTTVALHPVLAPGASPGFFIREPEGGSVASTGAMVGLSYTAPLVPGTYHLDAVDGSAPGNRATLALVVVAPPTVEVAPGALNLAMSGQFGFRATIRGIADQRVRWSLRNPSFGTITAEGIYELPSDPAPPPDAIDEVYAESVAAPGARGMARVTIHDGAAIQPGSVELAPGASFSFEPSPWDDPMVWSVVGGDAHGTITEWGEYTAPSTPGVYRLQLVVGGRPPAFATITVR